MSFLLLIFFLFLFLLFDTFAFFNFFLSSLSILLLFYLFFLFLFSFASFYYSFTFVFFALFFLFSSFLAFCLFVFEFLLTLLAFLSIGGQRWIAALSVSVQTNWIYLLNCFFIICKNTHFGTYFCFCIFRFCSWPGLRWQLFVPHGSILVSSLGLFAFFFHSKQKTESETNHRISAGHCGLSSSH